MANKSGTSEQVISLPKGGGAIQGIGETFSPDLFTGTGNFSVPIALPPGRNGFQPELNLVYSTGNGNGPFGLGWGLSIPGVSRKTSRGIPQYKDGDPDSRKHDTFILSGAEDLVPVAEPSTGVTRYRPRTEGLFALIDHHHASNNNHWQVRSKDGLISFYGTPESAGADPAVIADPADREKVFAWKLTETRDPFGNRIVYKYNRDLDSVNGRQWDQLYLEEIQYMEFKDSSGNDRFLVSVTFEYEELPEQYPDDVRDIKRIYPFSDYRAGFEMRTRNRCKRILVQTHPEENVSIRVRTYELIYLDERVDGGEVSEESLPRTGTSLLSQIKVVGHDDSQPVEEDRTQELPPLEFGYTPFDPEGRDFFPLEGRDLPPQSLGSPDIELADLFGNGLPDIFQMNGTVRYWRNRGGGRFDMPREMAAAPAGFSLADPGVQLMDANGDGRIDLLVTTGPFAGYFSTRPGGLWDERSFQRYELAPSFNLEDPEVQLVDLNGDGVTDAIRSGNRMECFFNDPREGWNNTKFIERRDIDEFPNVNFSDPRVRWADMSGDGLQDVVLIHDGNIEYWPNLGHGNWGRRIHMHDSPNFPFGYDPKRILVGDVNGNGLADVVYVDHCKIQLFINQSGSGWSDAIEIDGTPPVTDMDSVRLVDVLSTGISGILWSADATIPGRDHMFSLDFTGGIHPYVMNEMNNHMGAVTRVEYKSSTHFYLEDEKRPKTRWKTTLPFPVQTVSRVEVIDELSRGKLTTEYKYHHGYWDGGEREFRGFGMVEQFDTETFNDYNSPGLHGEDIEFERVGAGEAGESIRFSPPTVTRTWFHQGPVGEEFGEWYELGFRDVDELFSTDEYFSEDPQVIPRPDEVSDFLNTLPRRVKRDAVRALRGRILRTELYALDGTEQENRPYTVTEQLHSVLEEEPPQLDGEDRMRIFFSHSLGQRVTQWERGNDPMTQFSFNEDYDEFGQPRKQIQIACPRGWRDFQNSLSREYLTTFSETVFAKPDDDDIDENYIVDRLASTRGFEIKIDENTQELNVPDLKEQILSGVATRTLIGQTLNYYDGEAFIGLPHQEIGEFAALVRSESLVLTDEILREAYKSGDSVAVTPEIPPYLVPGSAPVWTDEYPEKFQARMDEMPPLAGYVFHPGDPEHERGYFVNTTRNSYDFHDQQTSGRGLLRITRDPLGDDTENRDTFTEYDRFDFLPEKVTDPVGLVTQADYDLRVLQPLEVTDPNRNRSRFSYTPLGLLKHIVVLGKEGELVGDIKDEPGTGFVEVPSTRFVYALLAFESGKQPVSVRTIQRVHHISETDVDPSEIDETIETLEYSDGFGRLLQTRTQAEDVIFGDPTFGGDLLPIDQSVSPGNVVGRRRAHDGPLNVVVSGQQIYDNKGRVVEEYEPFYDSGFDYSEPSEEKLGQKVTMFYDPRGQVVRTVNPDGSEQRIIFGVPGSITAPDVTKPDSSEPTPWEAYTYDVNDLAPLSLVKLPDGTETSLIDRAPQAHHFTPSSVLVDALGRAIVSVVRNGPDPDSDWFVTRSIYDIRGNVLTVIDALGRHAFKYTYDLADNPLRNENIDAGIRRTILDAAGNEIEGRDSKGAFILQGYDMLHRPVRLWARDGESQTLTLRERLIYGDGQDTGLSPAEVLGRNLRDALFKHYDEAGLLTFESNDFKGNVLDKHRLVISDKAILSVFPDLSLSVAIDPLRVDWEAPDNAALASRESELLDAVGHHTSATYDALNRVKIMEYPEDVNGERKKLKPEYNRAGALEKVLLDDEVFVDNIAYDAKGQRTFIALGNGVMTRHVYDPQTFRLKRFFTERYDKPSTGSLTYDNQGIPLQDLAYEYDLAGTILSITDRTPGSGVRNNPQAALIADPELASLVAAGDALFRKFTYDPIYRLISATGRECSDIPRPRPFTDDPRCGFNSGSHGTPDQDNAPDLTATYREEYAYDPVGNMLSMAHRNTGGSWKRHFGMSGMTPDAWNNEWPARLGTEEWPDPPGNKLTHVGDNNPVTGQTHFFDRNGNLIRENISRHFDWDHSDQMKSFRTDDGGGSSSLLSHYLYDSGGQRVKKFVLKQNGSFEVTTYVDGFFEHHRWGRKTVNDLITEGENSHLHIMDDQQRIALLRAGEPHPKDKGPNVQYHLGDHLGSSNVVVDENKNFINREEYTPYGESSFGSFGRKRYRFTGKERDEESGFYYHGARYYAPWVGRWTSTDPAGQVDGHNLYFLTRGNPINLTDQNGRGSSKANQVASELEKAAYNTETYRREFENARRLKDKTEESVRSLKDKMDRMNPQDPQFQDRTTGEFKEKKYKSKVKTLQHNIRQAKESLIKRNKVLASVEKGLDKANRQLQKLIGKAGVVGIGWDEVSDIVRRGEEASLNDAIERKYKRNVGKKGPQTSRNVGRVVRALPDPSEGRKTWGEIWWESAPGEIIEHGLRGGANLREGEFKEAGKHLLTVAKNITVIVPLAEAWLKTPKSFDCPQGIPICESTISPSAPSDWKNKAIPYVTTGIEVKSSGKVMYK